MFQGLQEDQLAGALEAMLFVTDEPVGTIALAEMLECEVGAVEAALVRLRDDLEARGSGIQLREVAGGWRLFTHPAYHELIEKYVLSWDTRKLSAAAMETLAIVAYTQPVTRAGVASVRGVNSDSSINSLVEKGLVREVGTEDAPGNPVLYGTTRGFLEKFGLRSPCRPARFGRFRARCGDASAHHGAVVGHAQGRAVVSDEQARTMARALMGEDFEADDGEAMLTDEELAQGTDAAAEVLADALEEERGEEAAAIAAGRAKIEDDEAAEAAGGGEGCRSCPYRRARRCRRRARHRRRRRHVRSRHRIHARRRRQDRLRLLVFETDDE
ncbi:MAG: SMC-Scp complex subunit ScpB [Adlercreutzia equolifaciens]